MSPGPRPRLRRENVDGVIVVSFTDTKIMAEDQIQEVGDEFYAICRRQHQEKDPPQLRQRPVLFLDRAG